MSRITTTSSPAVDVSTFNHPYTYSKEPTLVQLPLVPNPHLGTLPLQDPSYYSTAVPTPSTLFAESEFRSLSSPLEMSVPSLPNRPNLPPVGPPAYHTIPALSLADEEHPYTILHGDQPHLHQIDEATSEDLPAPRSSELSYTSAPMILRAHAPPEPTYVALSSVGVSDQTQARDAVHLPMSMAFCGFRGNEAAHAAPHTPPSVITANYATDHLNTVHTCQYVTGDSLCDADVGSTISSVRDHLKRVHAFRSAGKDVIKCLWAGCENALQRESIPRHIVSRHLRVKSREGMSRKTPTRSRRVEYRCTLRIS